MFFFVLLFLVFVVVFVVVVFCFVVGGFSGGAVSGRSSRSMGICQISVSHKKGAIHNLYYTDADAFSGIDAFRISGI